MHRKSIHKNAQKKCTKKVHRKNVQKNALKKCTQKMHRKSAESSWQQSALL